MRNLILTALILLTTLFAFGQSDKILCKSFVDCSKDFVVNVDCPKTIQRWNATYAKVELTIHTNVSAEVLSSMVKAGRYDYEVNVVDGMQVITLPKLSNQIILRGVVVSEILSMNIWLPEEVNLQEVSL